MDKRSAILSIHATLTKLGFKEVGPGPADYEGAIKVHGKPVDVLISIPDVRFASKPNVFLKNRSQIPLEVLAHVEQGKTICYSSGAGLPLDLYQPGQAVLRVLEEVRTTLELSFRGRGLGEIVDEYQHYWYPEIGVRTFLSRRSERKIVQANLFFAYEGGQAKFLCLASRNELRGYQVRQPTPAQIWYIEEKVGPGGSIDAPTTLSELQEWFIAQPGLGQSNWQNAFDWLVHGTYLFVAAPNALLGVKLVFPVDLAAGIKTGAIRQAKLSKIVQTRAHRVRVERFAGTWCDIEAIVGRNSLMGGNLLDTSVAVIGCGTIGSHLAKMLVQSGAGARCNFSLFDTDVLSEGNIGRHLLGFDDVGKAKAVALASELERFHPQTNIQPFSRDALSDWQFLAAHDVVIDCTGEWNVQCALNEMFLSEPVRPKAMLHSWVFMNGAGAQSFLNLRDEFACFRCLKPEFGGRWRFPAGNENEALNLLPASCGDGSYVPFSVDASVIAASLANRAAIDWAGGQPGPRLRTQVVDLGRGIYQKPRSPSPATNCPACGGRREAA